MPTSRSGSGGIDERREDTIMSAAAVLADALAQRVDDLVPALLPSAKCKGGYWTIGNLSNEPGSSLYIHVPAPRSASGRTQRRASSETALTS
jgi:hypothetical protein